MFKSCLRKIILFECSCLHRQTIQCPCSKRVLCYRPLPIPFLYPSSARSQENFYIESVLARVVIACALLYFVPRHIVCEYIRRALGICTQHQHTFPWTPSTGVKNIFFLRPDLPGCLSSHSTIFTVCKKKMCRWFYMHPHFCRWKCWKRVSRQITREVASCPVILVQDVQLNKACDHFLNNNTSVWSVQKLFEVAMQHCSC